MPFTALSGLEVKRAIIADITNQLERDTRFSAHLAYAGISWKWKFAADCYPRELGQIKIEAGATLHPPTARPLQEEEEPIHIDLEGAREVTAGIAPGGQTADSLRRETGQPVLTTKTVGGPAGERVTVEVPVIPQAPREDNEARPSHGKRSETNVAGGKGIVARRATLKTAAAPDGVEVAPAAGSAPTAEDAQKIIDAGLADGTLEKRE
jgi:hypothetical protein